MSISASLDRPRVVREAFDGSSRVLVLQVRTLVGDLFHVTYEGKLICWTPSIEQADQAVALLCAAKVS